MAGVKGMKRTIIVPYDEDQVVSLYENGMTQVEIALKMGLTQKIVWGCLKRQNVKCRIAKARNQTGENNQNWKGGNAGYYAFHRRLDAQFGKPQECEICETTNPNKRYHWASLTGNYQNLCDYKRMCKSCHAKYDNIDKNFKGRLI